MSDPDAPKPPPAAVIRFPQSRVRVGSNAEPFKHLGQSAFCAELGWPERQATGHWCSRCRGIWFGYPLEVTCPNCGNRHG